jgi:hypothetical protein
LSTEDSELIRVQGLSELVFTKDYVIPMFKETGYNDVRYTGGNEEHGRDVTFYDFDRLGNREDMAAQVKIGNISGVDVIRTVISEAISAFENPFVDPYSHESRNIHVLFVITSGNITTYALQEINNGLTRYPRIHFMNGRQVLDLRRQTLSQYLEYSRAEVLMRETGLAELLLQPAFIDEAEELLLLLFNDRGVTELEAINDLPNMLRGLASIRAKVEHLDAPMRSCVLHWFSIRLVTKAWYVYGKKKVFGLKEDPLS